jgi:hypothetical protein
MQMLMIIVESEAKEKVEAVLASRDGARGHAQGGAQGGAPRLAKGDAHEAPHRWIGYTEIPGVHGSGRTGPRLGSRAFPETSSILFAVVESEAVEGLVEGVRAAAGPRDGSVLMILWGVDRML